MTCHAMRDIHFRWAHASHINKERVSMLLRLLVSAAAGGWVVPDDGARAGQVAPGAGRQRDCHWGPGHGYTQVSHHHLLTCLPAPSSHAVPGQSLTHSLTDSLTRLPARPLARSLAHSLTRPLARSLAHSLTHSMSVRPSISISMSV